MTAHDAVVQPRFLLSSDLLVYSCSFVVQIPFLLTVQRRGCVARSSLGSRSVKGTD